MDRPAHTFVLPVPLSRWSHHTPRSWISQPNIGTENLIPVTNLLERLFVEERRRLKIIPNAFGERAVLKLMFGALIRAAERWRSIKVTEFEHRQITAVKKELDQEYEAQVGLKTEASKDATTVKISSSVRT
jgi:putative transposase